MSDSNPEPFPMESHPITEPLLKLSNEQNVGIKHSGGEKQKKNLFDKMKKTAAGK